MAKIKIVAVPAGPAPEHIRECWVRLELPLRNEDAEHYHVLLTEALAVLEENKHHLAANWWKTWGKEIGYVWDNNVCFKKEFCELIH